MAKAKKTSNVAMEVLAKMAGILVEASADSEVAELLAEAGLTVAAKGKGGKAAKAEPKAKAGKKKAKVTAAQIVEAIEEEEAIDISDADEDTLREAAVKSKAATKKKAGSMDEDELRELLNEAMGVS